MKTLLGKVSLTVLGVIVIVGIIEGCGAGSGHFVITEGRDYRSDNVKMIKEKVSSKEDVVNALGEPYSKADDTWRYYVVKKRTGIDRRWFGIPKKTEWTVQTELQIHFKDDVVERVFEHRSSLIK